MPTDSAPGTGAQSSPSAALVVDASPVSRQLLSLVLAPRFDIVAAHKDSGQVLDAQVSLRGAIGFLTKPITPRALFRALRGLDGDTLVTAAPRALLAPGDVSAEVIDVTNGEVLLRWEVWDISRSRALLLSHGPAVLGQLPQLRLQLGRETVETTSEVVRVQEPAWGVVPGLAVRFLEIDPGAELASDAFVGGWGLGR